VNVLLLGATGLVGHGVLHACLSDPAVRRVTAIARRPPEVTHPKLRVKARAEDALPAYPFPTYVFRPGYIKPMYGARPRERAPRVVYAATSWLYLALKRLMPERPARSARR
jgi:hypothetical protein